MPPYIPHTEQDIQRMLDVVGKPTLESLFEDVPPNVRMRRPLDLGTGLSELELTRRMTALADRNTQGGRLVSFIGAGAYDHVVPAAVDAVLSRQEFFTAYTPYQPEISQGTLQALFEYQTMICSLTGLQVSNASLYDASSAYTEAARMAIAQTRRQRVLVSAGIHPNVFQAMKTALGAIGATLETIPLRDGRTDMDTLSGRIRAEASGAAAAIIIQSPNFLGYIEDVDAFSAEAHTVGALMIHGVMDALSLAVLRTPGESGADIAAGSGQCFGGELAFGGPAFGFITTTEKLMRKLPGRIVGQSADVDGRRAFVLTLQAREQHIRREKATSNICSNHSLNALRAAAYLALVGPRGLRRSAEDSMRKARLLEQGLLSTGRFERISNAPYFREFALRCRVDGTVFHREMRKRGSLGGYDLAWLDSPETTGLPRDVHVFCATEKTGEGDIRRFVTEVAALPVLPDSAGGVA